jgi:putative ABC transport system permease protein
MNAATAQSLVLFVLISFGAVGLIALRRPVQRRFALRNIVRRRGEALLVISGSLLGAALLTGSFVVGDTLHASQRATAATQLGPVDEMIVLHERAEAQKLESLIEGLNDSRIDGVTTLVTADAAVVFDGRGNSATAEPRALVIEADFADIAAFGDDRAATGLSGSTPPPGQVMLGSDLARALGATEGETVTAHLYGKELVLRVKRVVPRLGIAGLEWEGRQVTSPNAFIAPGTLDGIVDAHSLEAGVMPPHARVLVSNRGGVEAGATLSRPVAAAIREALPAEARSLDIDLVKKDRLDAARTSGDYFGGIFLAIGSFAVIAGILLLVSIFVMLAEERKGQLGMLRAVGTKRADLIKGFVIEGAIYSLVASAVGSVAGIGIGRGIIQLAAPLLSDGEDAFSLVFAAEPSSIVGGFCLGALIALATVLFTSVRISRINVIRAIRDLPEPKLRSIRSRTVALGIVFAAVGGLGFVSAYDSEDAWPLVVAGPVLLVLGLIPLASRLLGRKRAAVAGFSMLLGWGIFGNAITDGRFFAAESTAAYVFQGVIITFAAVALLSLAQELVQRGIRSAASSWLALRLGTAYPIANRFRTSLTLGMYALVMFTLVFVAALSGTFNSQIEAETAKVSSGFDVIADASAANPPPVAEVKTTQDVERVVTALGGDAVFERDGKDPQQWPVTGIDEGFVASGAPRLRERESDFASDRDAWDALASGSDGIIVSPFFLHVGGDHMAKLPGPGDMVRTLDPVTGHEHDYRVLGVLESDPTFMGAVMSKDALMASAPSTVSASRFYIDVAGGEGEARAVARDLENALIDHGVEAETLRSIVEAHQQSTVQFLGLMQAFLALGLVVGIAGLGVVMVRAVRERRHDIGVLRSLGFQSGRVRQAFTLEAGMIAFEGIVIGAGLALVTAYQGVRAGDFGDGVAFTVPWAHLAVLIGVAFGASLLATAWPARKASRIAPATALRVAD